MIHEFLSTGNGWLQMGVHGSHPRILLHPIIVRYRNGAESRYLNASEGSAESKGGKEPTPRPCACSTRRRPTFKDIAGSLLAMQLDRPGRPGGPALHVSLLPMQPSLEEGRPGVASPFGRGMAAASSCMDNSAIITSPVDDSFF